jgi:lipid-A-disaccharide synthase
LAVVASGTATLEAALAGTPTIIVYRLAPLSYELGRRLIKVEHIGMANLLAGERLFPEILQDEFTPERLAQEVIGLVKNPQGLAALKMGLGRIINNLGGPGASARAAQVAWELMEGEKDD